MTNPVTHALEEALEKAGTAAGKDGVQAVETLLGDTEKGLVKSVGNHAEHDAERAAELKAIAERAHTREDLRENLGPTPVYHINDKGVVTKLTKDGRKPLTQEDRDRLPLKLDSDNRIMQHQGDEKPYPLPPGGDERPRVPSQQVPLDHDEMARAVQLARHEDKSYGGYKKLDDGTDKFQANNYAALRYGEEGDPNGFLLVARSRFMGPHSERALGMPLLDAESTHGITALYTEREPCHEGQNCGVWMHEYLPNHVKVTHSVEYGDTPESRAVGNRQMEDHLNALRVPKPHRRYRP